MFRFTIVISVFLVLGGCVIFKPAKRDKSPLEIPARYSLHADSSDNEPGGGRKKWWRAFNSEELNGLIARALSGGFDIETARARFSRAYAAARKINAEAMPVLRYEAGAKTKRARTKISSSKRETVSGESSWRLNMAASYEIDLWGRANSLRRAGAVDVEAARKDLEAAAVTVSAKVAETWIDIIAVRRKIGILEKQIKANADMLEIQKMRFLNGMTNALDLSRQREAVAAIKAEKPLLRLQETRLVNSLAFLLGMASAKGLEISQKTVPGLIPMPGSGLPADLLGNRPDVRAAALRLKSADWEVSAASANLFPSISLSAQSVFSNENLNLLFENWITTLAASLAGPIFDGKRRKAEVERARATARERLIFYARTVARAVREVEDSMAEENLRQVYLKLLKERLKAARATLKNALVIYRNGRGDYLSYLNALTGAQRFERELVWERASLAKSRVALYRALGGDWTKDLPNFAKKNKKKSSP